MGERRRVDERAIEILGFCASASNEIVRHNNIPLNLPIARSNQIRTFLTSSRRRAVRVSPWTTWKSTNRGFVRGVRAHSTSNQQRNPRFFPLADFPPSRLVEVGRRAPLTRDASHPYVSRSPWRRVALGIDRLDSPSPVCSPRQRSPRALLLPRARARTLSRSLHSLVPPPQPRRHSLSPRCLELLAK